MLVGYCSCMCRTDFIHSADCILLVAHGYYGCNCGYPFYFIRNNASRRLDLPFYLAYRSRNIGAMWYLDYWFANYRYYTYPDEYFWGVASYVCRYPNSLYLHLVLCTLRCIVPLVYIERTVYLAECQLLKKNIVSLR